MRPGQRPRAPRGQRASVRGTAAVKLGVKKCTWEKNSGRVHSPRRVCPRSRCRSGPAARHSCAPRVRPPSHKAKQSPPSRTRGRWCNARCIGGWHAQRPSLHPSHLRARHPRGCTGVGCTGACSHPLGVHGLASGSRDAMHSMPMFCGHARATRRRHVTDRRAVTTRRPHTCSTDERGSGEVAGCPL